MLVTSLLDYVTDSKSDEEKLRIIVSYLKSDRLAGLPFNKIYSAIWAAIAYQASRRGRTTVPNIGMFSDIEMISTLLPYCDAIFVDKDMNSLLSFGEVKKFFLNIKRRYFL